MNQIGQGRTADIFEHPDDASKVIKLCKPFVPENDVHREFGISHLAHSLGVQTPKPYEIIRLQDRMGIVFERADGVSLLKMLGKRPLQAKRFARKLATLHHSIHQHKVDEDLVRQIDMLQQHIRSASDLTEKEKQSILACLDKLPQDSNHLCHGDFHPDNVMVGEKDWILDWVNGIRGNPSGDVARTILLLSIGSMPPGTPRYVEVLTNTFRKLFKDQYVKEYLRLSGMDYAEIDKWMLPVAAARLNEGIPQEEKNQLLKIIRGRLSGGSR